jgi:hypothetical protein
VIEENAWLANNWMNLPRLGSGAMVSLAGYPGVRPSLERKAEESRR